MEGNRRRSKFLQNEIVKFLFVMLKSQLLCQGGLVCVCGWMDGWMDGRTDGRMDGWEGGWMDGWMDGSFVQKSKKLSGSHKSCQVENPKCICSANFRNRNDFQNRSCALLEFSYNKTNTLMLRIFPFRNTLFDTSVLFVSRFWLDAVRF